MSYNYTRINWLRTYALEYKPAVCEILAIYWASGVTKYYGTSAFDELPPFNTGLNVLGVTPIIPAIKAPKFSSFDMLSDLTTEDITFTFSDVDGDIKADFDTYGEGVKCEIFYYWPKVRAAGSETMLMGVWWGHMLLPEFSGRGVLQVTAENGFASRELTLGHRIRPNSCTQIFGGKFTSATQYRGNGCTYDRQLGGSVGNLNSGVPYTSCDKSKAACVARMGSLANGEPKYWMGFITDVAPVVTDPGSGYSAAAKGNASRLKEPIGIVAGQKYVSNLRNLFYRKELNSSEPDKGWVRGVWEVAEGPNETVDEMVINDKIIEAVHTNYMTGTLGQERTSYSPNISGFSGTAVVNAAYGWTNAATTELESLKTRVRVKGYNKVRVYSDETTYSETWTNKRLWWLIELYTNIRFGRGERHDKFHIADSLPSQTWLDTDVTHTDGNGATRQTKRDQFDCFIDGRPAEETIIDICRAGRISVPYQWDGKYLITPLEKESSLGTVKVFTDTGSTPNIIRKNGQTVRKSRIPHSKLVNKVVLTYEDSQKYDRERPLVFIDEAQQALAASSIGLSSFKEVEKRYKAYGIRHENMAYKLGDSLLRVGPMDSGGTANNLSIEFYSMFEQILGIKKYQVIQVVSDTLDDEDFEYFRVMGIKKFGNHEVLVKCQAYNPDFYDTFEVTNVSPPAECSVNADCPDGFHCIGGVCVPYEPPPVCDPGVNQAGITYVNNVLTIPIEPC